MAIFRMRPVRGLVFVLISAAILSACAGDCRAGRVRVEITAEMISAEGGGDAWMLFDEPGDGGYPPVHKPQTIWHPGWKPDSHPAAMVVDIGRQRDIAAVCLFDLNADGDFLVRSGEPGKWSDLIREDCKAYARWKNHAVSVRTRYLRFERTAGGANVAEAVIFEHADSLPPVEPTDDKREKVDAGELFGSLPLVDEVTCGRDPADRPFTEWPAGISRTTEIAGRTCRVLPNTPGGPKYFAYRMGGGRGLKAGRAYLIDIEYPQDKPRTFWILNRGCETERGFHTGPTVGDALHAKYVSSNAESLDIPLTGRYERWRMMFFLHDRFGDIELPRGAGPRPMTPEDGFWLIVAQPDANQAPLSAGSAVSRIRLFEVPDPRRFAAKYTLPDELPKRRLFFREEMGDGVIASEQYEQRGVRDDTAWAEYKAQLMLLLGMNTYCKDLLEFGHNQGFDSGKGWYNQSPTPMRWSNILTMLGDYDFDVLPYYEYCGSVGPTALGSQKRCITLAGGKQYTHIAWSEKANADITDPDTLADAKKLLDYTIVRHKDKVRFAGAWFRPRPGAIPISFSDRCLKLFASQANSDKAVTREQLSSDSQLLQRYREWWFLQRRAFLQALRTHLRDAGVCDNPLLLYTTDTSEPGIGFPQWDAPMVACDPRPWSDLGEKVISLSRAIDQGLYAAAVVSDRLTWGQWEWQHACPRNDPQNYRDLTGVLLTYTFNRAYTVASPWAIEPFRSPSGLAMVRHYCLNEDMLDKRTGYFVCDVDRTGPYCMMPEALAVANADPWYIGYLAGGTFNRGSIEHVRAFNQAFLALPALPGKVMPAACPDSAVVVRAIKTPSHGTYFAVVNTSLTPIADARIDLGLKGHVRDCVTSAPISADNGTITLSMEPCQLRSLVVR